MKGDRLSMLAAVLVLIAVFCSAGIFGYWYFTGLTPPITIQRLTVTPTQGYPGDYLTVTMEYCKSGSDDADVKYVLENHIQINLTKPGSEPRGPGCRTMTEYIEIPPKIPAVKYRLWRTATYHPNFLSWPASRIHSNEFEVLDPPAQPPSLPREVLNAITSSRVELERLRISDKAKTKMISDLEQRLNDLKIANKLKENFPPKEQGGKHQ